MLSGKPLPTPIWRRDVAPSLSDRQDLLLSMGHSPRDARVNALVQDIIATETELEQRGGSYSDARVRIAQVHARDDVILLCAQMREVLRTGDEQVTLLRQIRWILVVLAAVMLLRAFA